MLNVLAAYYFVLYETSVPIYDTVLANTSWHLYHPLYARLYLQLLKNNYLQFSIVIDRDLSI